MDRSGPALAARAQDLSQLASSTVPAPTVPHSAMTNGRSFPEGHKSRLKYRDLDDMGILADIGQMVKLSGVDDRSASCPRFSRAFHVFHEQARRGWPGQARP